MSRTQLAAYIGIFLLNSVAIVQILVCLEILPVQILWGGNYETLSLQLRVAGYCAAVVLVFFSLLLFKRGIQRTQETWLRNTLWFFFGYMCFNTIGNALSKNAYERLFMTPTTILLAVCSFVVVTSTGEGPGTEPISDIQAKQNYGSLA